MGPAEPVVTPSGGPSARAIRMWTGVLVAVWILVLAVAVVVFYANVHFQVAEQIRPASSADEDGRLGHAQPGPPPPGYWHAVAGALASAVLAMVFIVAGAGLILGADWSWWLLLAGAIAQILATVTTQVWQAMLPVSSSVHFADSRMGLIGALIGTILWSVVPVGLIILSAAGWRRCRTNAIRQQGDQGAITC